MKQGDLETAISKISALLWEYLFSNSALQNDVMSVTMGVSETQLKHIQLDTQK